MRNEGESGERREVMVSTSAEIRTSARPWCLVSGEGMQIRVLAPRLVSQAAENEDNIRKVASLTHRLFAVTPSGGFLSSHSFPVGPGLWLALRHALTDLKREVVAGIYATHSTICIQPSHQLGAEVIDKKLRAELDSLAADDRDPVDGSKEDFPDFDITLCEGPDLDNYLLPSPPTGSDTFFYSVCYFGFGADTMVQERAAYNTACQKYCDEKYNPPPFDLVAEAAYGLNKKMLVCGTGQAHANLVVTKLDYLAGACGSPVCEAGATGGTFSGVHVSGRSANGKQWNVAYSATHPALKKLYKEIVIPRLQTKGCTVALQQLQWMLA
eukprot:TRINITY_DN7520_c0_g1_i1.p1 TRINITY_DN7520_c0_g1~~TRINITY_DN7520_c0_g1_i1.p1  ORF type:complete len:326 (+),score=47.32 TRINITY_DN7520_c0_g1_i1:505-1482(+)